MIPGNSLVAQWLGLRTFTAKNVSIPGWGTKIPQAMGKKQKQTTTTTKRSNNSIRKPVHFPNLTIPFFMFNHKGLDLFRENEQESYKYGSMVCGCIIVKQS